MIDAILATETLPQNVDFYVYPADAGADSSPVYARGSGRPRRAVRAEVGSSPCRAALLVVDAQAGDANWNLVVVPAKGGLITFYRAWLVLAAVILVFGAVLAYMWSSVRYALRLETTNGRILELAQTDLLTNLANRRAFIKRLTHGVHSELARRTALCHALSRHR